jgi:hypothetical protein
MAPSSLSTESWILILVALVAANAAYTSRKFLFFKTVEDKHVGWCLLEMGVWYALIGLIGYSLESMIGNVFQNAGNSLLSACACSLWLPSQGSLGVFS